MKIRKMRVIPLAIPDPPLWNAAGVHQPYALRSLVELHADNGLVGVGEGYGDEQALRALEAAVPLLEGADPYRLTEHELVFAPRIFSAVEVAALDLIGKATGTSVAELLGGRQRDRVEYAGYLFYKYAADARYKGRDHWGEVMTPQTMVGEARTFVERWGFKVLKVKGGVLPPAEEVETMRLLHEAFPSFPLRLDPNACWSVDVALQVADQLKSYNNDYLEDPVRGMEQMAHVRQNCDLPLATNMCVTAFKQLPEAVRLAPIDVVLSDHHFWGGLRACMRLSFFCRDFDWGVSMHSNTHLGVSLAAMTHIGAAMPHVTHALDTHYPWLQHDILTEPITIADGCVQVPTGPGLGVEVDPERVAQLHAYYSECGIRSRDDATEARRYIPGWQRPNWMAVDAPSATHPGAAW